MYNCHMAKTFNSSWAYRRFMEQHCDWCIDINLERKMVQFQNQANEQNPSPHTHFQK
jgi:hypothetical protein